MNCKKKHLLRKQCQRAVTAPVIFGPCGYVRAEVPTGAHRQPEARACSNSGLMSGAATADSVRTNDGAIFHRAPLVARVSSVGHAQCKERALFFRPGPATRPASGSGAPAAARCQRPGACQYTRLDETVAALGWWPRAGYRSVCSRHPKQATREPKDKDSFDGSIS